MPIFWACCCIRKCPRRGSHGKSAWRIAMPQTTRNDQKWYRQFVHEASGGCNKKKCPLTVLLNHCSSSGVILWNCWALSSIVYLAFLRSDPTLSGSFWKGPSVDPVFHGDLIVQVTGITSFFVFIITGKYASCKMEYCTNSVISFHAHGRIRFSLQESR